MKNALKLIGICLVAVAMSVNFSACCDDDDDNGDSHEDPITITRTNDNSVTIYTFVWE